LENRIFTGSVVFIESQNTEVPAFTRSHPYITIKMYALEALQTAKGIKRGSGILLTILRRYKP
jgi:hypothetical protein